MTDSDPKKSLSVPPELDDIDSSWDDDGDDFFGRPAAFPAEPVDPSPADIPRRSSIPPGPSPLGRPSNPPPVELGERPTPIFDGSQAMAEASRPSPYPNIPGALPRPQLPRGVAPGGLGLRPPGALGGMAPPGGKLALNRPAVGGPPSAPAPEGSAASESTGAAPGAPSAPDAPAATERPRGTLAERIAALGEFEDTEEYESKPDMTLAVPGSAEEIDFSGVMDSRPPDVGNSPALTTSDLPEGVTSLPADTALSLPPDAAVSLPPDAAESLPPGTNDELTLDLDDGPRRQPLASTPFAPETTPPSHAPSSGAGRESFGPASADLKLDLEELDASTPLDLANQSSAAWPAVTPPEPGAAPRPPGPGSLSLPELQTVSEPPPAGGQPGKPTIARDSLELEISHLEVPTAPTSSPPLHDDPAAGRLPLANEEVHDRPPPPFARPSDTGFELDGAAAPAQGRDPAVQEMKDKYAMGDFSGALVIAENLLDSDGEDLDARRYAESCREVLTQMYSARLGPLERVPSVAIPPDQIRWLSLDHRAGFLLSLVDGHSSLEEILDISGMTRLESLRILHGLLEQNVISVG